MLLFDNKSVFKSSTGHGLKLKRCLGSGAQGKVYATDDPLLVAKILNNKRPEAFDKLYFMMDFPPELDEKNAGNTSLAWPVDIVRNNSGKDIGYLMPNIDGMAMQSVYEPKLRKKHAPHFTWLHLHLVALNLCKVFHALHEKGYVIGDVNQSNVLVRPDTSVAIVGTDSMQFTDASGKTYYATGKDPHYLAPELINKNLVKTPRTAHSDNFALAVLFHQLLLGVDPIPNNGILANRAGEYPSVQLCIQNNYWNYANNGVLRPSAQSMKLEILHPYVQEMFLAAFNDGFGNPEKRPNPMQWSEALQEAINNLQVCAKHSQHVSTRRKKCSWCEIKRNTGTDYFPNVGKHYRLDEKLIRIFQMQDAGDGADEQRMLEAWQTLDVGNDPVLNNIRDVVNRINSDLGKLDEFKTSVTQNRDERELLDLWEQNLETSHSRLVKDSHIGGQNIADYVDELRKTRRLYKVLDELDFSAAVSSLRHERELIDNWMKLRSEMAECARYEYFENRVSTAEDNLRIDAKFSETKSDLFELALAWEKYGKNLRRFEEYQAELDSYDELVSHVENFDLINRKLKHDDYKEALQIWNANAGLHDSEVAQQVSGYTDNRPLMDYMLNTVAVKCAALEELETLYASCDGGEIFIHHNNFVQYWQSMPAWLQTLKDPEFVRFANIYTEANLVLDFWETLDKTEFDATVFLQNIKRLTQLDRAFFNRIQDTAVKDKIAGKIQAALDNVRAFSESVYVDSEISERAIVARWEWLLDSVPLALVAIETPADSHPNGGLIYRELNNGEQNNGGLNNDGLNNGELKNKNNCKIISRSQFGKNDHGARLYYDSFTEECVVSVRPMVEIFDKKIYGDRPLIIDFKPVPQVDFGLTSLPAPDEFSLWMSANRDIDSVELQLVANPFRYPLHGDEMNTVLFDEILDLEAGIPKRFTLSTSGMPGNIVLWASLAENKKVKIKTQLIKETEEVAV